MRIRALETRNFGRLPNGRIEFTEGLTVVSGANEAGKSFTIRAIYAGLFDETTSRGERDLWRKWGAEGPFEVTLEMESGDGIVSLSRDLDKRKAVLTKADGTEVTDKKTIQKTVGKLLGLPSLKSFQATACILQDAVKEVDGQDAGLKQLLEGQLAGAGKETDKLLADLKKAVNKIKPPKAPGILGGLQAERDRYASDLDALRERLESLATSKMRLEAVKRDLDEKNGRAKIVGAAYQGAKDYKNASTAYQEALDLYGEAQADINLFDTAIAAVAAAETRLAQIGPQIQGLGESISAAESVERARADLEALAEQEANLGNRIARIAVCDAAIREAEAKLTGIREVKAEDLQTARALPTRISSMAKTLADQLFNIRVEVAGEARFSITVDGKVTEGQEGTAHHTASVEFPGTGIVHFENVTGEVPELAKDLADVEANLAEILARYETADLADLEQLDAGRKALVAELQRARDERAGILDEETLELLTESRARIAGELEQARAAREAIEGGAMTPEALEEARQTSVALDAERVEQQGIFDTNKGILSALVSEAALREKGKAALGKLATAEHEKEKLSAYECDAVEYAKLEAENEELAAALPGLIRERIQLETLINAETIGEEDAALAEESLAEVEGKIARLAHRKLLLETVAGSIREARERTIGQFAEGLESRMGEVLDRITQGKYNRVSVDGNLSVSVYSPEKNSFLEMKDDRSLSGGTRDQVFLAARIALLELITGEAHPPLIMDDTFCSFDDMGRKERAFEMMAALAEHNQILYFTCQDCPADLPTLRLA